MERSKIGMITINLKKLDKNAKPPSKAHYDDFCYDVWAVSEKEIAPNVWKYGLGFSYEIMDDLNKDTILSIDFRPRSSIWKTGMVLSNSTGTLDFGYRNEVFVVFYHVMTDMPRYKVGDKIGQIKIGTTTPIIFQFVDEINEDTERGMGGFGSTGNN